MYLSAKDDHYMLVGMPWDPLMIVGMALMAVGYALVIYGLAPRFSRTAHRTSQVEIEALDNGKLSAAHVKLMLVLMLGVAVDTQKPFTFAFILPGVADEYNLHSASHPAPGHWPVALFPFVAIVGTVVGSLVWGRLGDAIGRRASILLAATLFFGTALCSVMPAFHWNLVACFFMGMSAGGLLPIVYSLLAETIPARRRGGAIVLVAGIGTALGFLLASWTAHWLIPTYGWRIMWFFGIPTGLALILLNRYIPESPRFLLARGRNDEAHAVLRRFGVVVTERQAPPELDTVRPGFASVFRAPYSMLTPVLILYGLAWGLANFGFLVWLTVYAQRSGVSATEVTTIIAKAALFAIPGSIAVAWLYQRWSSRGTLIVAAAVESGALLVFSFNTSVVHDTTLFTVLLVVLLVAMWATVSALAPYAAEVYPTAIRGVGSGVVAGSTKLGGVVALAIAVMSWSPPSVGGAALLAAIPAGMAALLLLVCGVETRGRRLEEISAVPEKRRRTVRIGAVTYPVIGISPKDPRLHLSLTFVALHLIGQIEFHFRLSVPQILAALLTCALIEVVVTARQKRLVIWPASALLTGNGIAFIMRIPGTEHGDWWSFNGVWIYVAVAAVAMASKYLIVWRGKHVFNPSNLGLVLAFLILGSTRTEPLQFWWGPVSPALLIVLGTIVAGALVILSRVHLLQVAVLFWVTFAASMGLLALSGHAFSANWHLGPVADGFFWRVLITSPEVFIFTCFMITDPRTAPDSPRGRQIYAVAIGLLSSLLIAPQQTEFAAKVALLGSLTLVCAARPLAILGRETLERRRASRPRRSVLAGGATFGLAGFAGLLLVAGAPARSLVQIPSAPMAQPVQVSFEPTPGVVAIDRATADRIASDAIDDLRLAAKALSRRDATVAMQCASGTFLADLQARIGRGKGRSIVVPTYQVDAIHIKLRPAIGQEPPTVVATLRGTVTSLTYSPTPGATPERGAPAPFNDTFNLALVRDRFLIIDDDNALPLAGTTRASAAPAVVSKGVGPFRQLRLTNVAPKVGLDFRQGAFRFGVTPDPAAMMGGGLCWLDYDNDGWMDLFVVNSYGGGDIGAYSRRGGLPETQLYRNVHGRFTNVTARAHAGRAVRGEGCVAADFNGDGNTDLFVTTAQSDELLWNDGDGRFTEGARSHGVVSFGWHSSAAVADVNGDGRPDLYVAGYTEPDGAIPASAAGFPTNHLGVRDLLFLNEGNGPDGRARFREVGKRVGVDRAPFDHTLGTLFTDVNGDGRPDLYVANDGDPNKVYLNAPGGPLGFRFVDQAKAWKLDDPNAGMGVAGGDFTADGVPDLFITNSRVQEHAAYQSAPNLGGSPRFEPQMAKFAAALRRGETVGWGDAFVDLDNDSSPDLVVANGAIPVTNLKTDAQPLQVLQGLGARGRPGAFANATGVIASPAPKVVGRGLAVADVNNDGRMEVAVNSIGGPVVLLESAGPSGHWLGVSLTGFHPGAVVTAVLPNGRKLVQEAHAGGSYLSSHDPRLHFGLGDARSVSKLVVRYPDGRTTTIRNVAADRILTVGTNG
jgi:putative MFS transporter